jgi:chemotaxis protein methyltransferase CheR
MAEISNLRTEISNPKNGAVLADEEFDRLRKTVYSFTGIALDDNKKYLLENRLRSLLLLHNIADYETLHRQVLANDGTLRQNFIDAVSTHETSFFRDKSPFVLLAHKIFPDLETEHPSKSIKIWCAACSTGQEVYSVAITAKEVLLDLQKYPIHITGTDISDASVAYASRGYYSAFEVGRGLDASQIQKYFLVENKNYKIVDEIRSLCTFTKHNLFVDAYPANLHIVFCRNVAIYFQESDRRKIFEKIHKSLLNGGILLIGSTETLQEHSDLFTRKVFQDKVYYVKK